MYVCVYICIYALLKKKLRKKRKKNYIIFGTLVATLLTDQK